jgi:hypothetical protein
VEGLEPSTTVVTQVLRCFENKVRVDDLAVKSWCISTDLFGLAAALFSKDAETVIASGPFSPFAGVVCGVDVCPFSSDFPQQAPISPYFRAQAKNKPNIIQHRKCTFLTASPSWLV